MPHYHLEENQPCPPRCSARAPAVRPSLSRVGGARAGRRAHLALVEHLQLRDSGDDELPRGVGPAPRRQGVPEAGQRLQTLQLVQLVDERPLRPNGRRSAGVTSFRLTFHITGLAPEGRRGWFRPRRRRRAAPGSALLV